MKRIIVFLVFSFLFANPVFAEGFPITNVNTFAAPEKQPKATQNDAAKQDQNQYESTKVYNQSTQPTNTDNNNQDDTLNKATSLLRRFLP